LTSVVFETRVVDEARRGTARQLMAPRSRWS
jgi:hypothetical protein